jgi:hypothetical protein
MIGRAYDPAIGKFLTPDPIIHDPFYSQSHNGYSYVYNRPTVWTDPTGFSGEECTGSNCVGGGDGTGTGGGSGGTGPGPSGGDDLCESYPYLQGCPGTTGEGPDDDPDRLHLHQCEIDGDCTLNERLRIYDEEGRTAVNQNVKKSSPRGPKSTTVAYTGAGDPLLYDPGYGPPDVGPDLRVAQNLVHPQQAVERAKAYADFIYDVSEAVAVGAAAVYSAIFAVEVVGPLVTQALAAHGFGLPAITLGVDQFGTYVATWAGGGRASFVVAGGGKVLLDVIQRGSAPAGQAGAMLARSLRAAGVSKPTEIFVSNVLQKAANSNAVISNVLQNAGQFLGGNVGSITQGVDAGKHWIRAIVTY